MTATRALLPKEHGAYGQVIFPLVSVFVVAGISPAGLAVSAAVVAGFLAHEPAVIVLGLRGQRARRELASAAARWLGVCLAVGLAAALTAVIIIDPAARWSLLVPSVPAVVLVGAMVSGREKSWYGETAAAFAFAGVAVPVAMAAGASADAALAVAIPFAVLFITTTLAVRVVILRVRGGGDPRAATATRRATLTIAAASAVLIAAMTRLGWLAPSMPFTSAPGLLTSALVAARPPSPARLRALGWTLVAVSTLTAVIVMMTV
jgi:YwiC-like protein